MGKNNQYEINVDSLWNIHIIPKTVKLDTPADELHHVLDAFSGQYLPTYRCNPSDIKDEATLLLDLQCSQQLDNNSLPSTSK